MRAPGERDMLSDHASIDALLTRVRPVDESLRGAAQARQDALTKPPGSLGRLEEIALWAVAATGHPRPRADRRAVVIFAGDHGVTAEGVSPYPSEVTAQMVQNFIAGGAAINALSKAAGASLEVVDVGVRSPLSDAPGLWRARVAPGTRNFTREPAMTEAEARAALGVGASVAASLVARGIEIVALGEMGIGNTTAASALTAALTGRPPHEVTGHGTGLDEEGRRRKVAVVARALALHQPSARAPLALLSCVGGLEIAAIAGACLELAAARRMVVLDGFISTAGGAVAVALCPAVRGYLLAGHRSTEPGHQALLAWMQLSPVLDLGLRLGEGTGAALALSVVGAALAAFDEMATFAEAAVSGVSGPR